MTNSYRSAVLLALSTLAGSHSRPAIVREDPPAPARTYELRHGHWLADTGFVDRTVWVVGSAFQLTAPAHIDSVLDLHGGYVVPPFAEAHNHWLEAKLVRNYIARYLLDGVFYVRDMGNFPSNRPAIDSLVNRPTTVDYYSAERGFTGPGGHPLEVVDQLVGIGTIPQPRTAADTEQYIFVVRDEADVQRAWPKLMSDHPALVKVFLAYSEEYAQRLNDPNVGAHRGMDPALLPGLVRRAHAAGLPIAAHIETAADFRTAVAAGVNDIAHMPFYDDSIGAARYLLTPADAQAAARRGIRVSTTISWSAKQGPDDTTRARRTARDVVRRNLTTLRAANVQLLVGSDQFRHSSVVEADALAATGVFSPLTLVRLWGVATPLAIFPRRHVGRFADGYEASLLVLKSDPRKNFGATHEITLRMKQGVLLFPREADAQFPPLPGS